MELQGLILEVQGLIFDLRSLILDATGSIFHLKTLILRPLAAEAPVGFQEPWEGGETQETINGS